MMADFEKSLDEDSEREVRRWARLLVSAPAIMMLVLGIFAPVLARAAVTEDARDRAYVQALVNRSLETQRTMVETQWSNPETGSKGVIIVERTNYKTPTMPCRDYYRTTIPPRGEPLRVRGSGCRVSPGSWQLDEQPPIAEASLTARSAPPPPSSPGGRSGSRGYPPSAKPEQTPPVPQPSAEPKADPPSPAAKEETEAARSKPPPPAPPKPPPFPSFTLPSKAAS